MDIREVVVDEQIIEELTELRGVLGTISNTLTIMLAMLPIAITSRGIGNEEVGNMLMELMKQMMPGGFTLYKAGTPDEEKEEE